MGAPESLVELALLIRLSHPGTAEPASSVRKEFDAEYDRLIAAAKAEGARDAARVISEKTMEMRRHCLCERCWKASEKAMRDIRRTEREFLPAEESDHE